ncbi:hypothetical protein ACHHV8_04355 [Paenibacillus sp. TAB 01]|uniref:hypothetical protein n=1 Tax=Paenibacillus sp. TAB 01 TaxID=3368988 RepID=UPI003750C1A4
MSFLRFLGWLFVPYVMIFVRWKKLKGLGKTLGGIWAVIALLMVIGNMAGSKDQQPSQSSAPVTATIDTKAQAPDENKLKAEADAKAKAEADAKAKAEADAKAKAEAEAKAKAEEEARKPIVVSGKGNTATDPFTLKAGFVVVDGSHTGNSNFALQFMDSSGGTKKLLVNEIGNYKGKTLALIPKSGDYLFNVSADGKWNLSLSQVIPSEVPNAPTSLKGSGDDVVFVNLQKKLTKFTFNHSGSSNFVVMLNGRNLLVNEIGNYEGSKAQSINDAGPYAISVQADGDWSIDIN